MVYSVYALVLHANLTSDTLGSSLPHKYVITRQELFCQAVSYILKPLTLQLFPPKFLYILIIYVYVYVWVYMYIYAYLYLDCLRRLH